MSVDLSAGAVESRLREASRLAGSLRPEHRLETKIDLRGPAVAARLREASELLDLCRVLASAKELAADPRPFQPSDAAPCCRVIAAAIQTMDGLNAEARAFLAAKNLPETLRDELAHAFVLVASGHDGAPRALGVLEGGEIKRVYVHPDSQRQGIGTAIVRALEAEARRRALTSLSLQASPSSVPFYRSLGYLEGERVTTGRGEAEFTHVRMSKPLR